MRSFKCWLCAEPAARCVVSMDGTRPVADTPSHERRASKPSFAALTRPTTLSACRPGWPVVAATFSQRFVGLMLQVGTNDAISEVERTIWLSSNTGPGGQAGDHECSRRLAPQRRLWRQPPGLAAVAGELQNAAPASSCARPRLCQISPNSVAAVLLKTISAAPKAGAIRLRTCTPPI